MAEPFEPPPAYDGVPTAPPHSGYNPGYPPPQQPYYPPDPGYPPPQQQPYYDQPGQPPYHDQMPQGAPGYQGYQGYPPPSQPMAAYPPPQGKPAPTAHGYHQPYPKSVQYGGQPYQAARNPKRAPRRQRPRAPASELNICICSHAYIIIFVITVFLMALKSIGNS